MAAAAQRPKLVTIVGPTASGKSALAMRIAKEFDGEIICADSRTVYRGMDIGTAKPTKDDQAEVKHWALDLVEPGQRFSAYQFKKYALKMILDIQGRDKLPILVGGTGLYVDGTIFDFGFTAEVNPTKRKKLEALNTEALQDFIREMSLPMPFNLKNRRHLIRTIESKGQVGSRKNRPSKDVILIGILPPDETLKKRIGQRAEQILKDGVLDETKKLVRKHGKKAIANASGIAYKICLEVIDGKISNLEAIGQIKTAEWQYARRQKTWFKRNPYINWFNSSQAAYEFVKNQLLNT